MLLNTGRYEDKKARHYVERKLMIRLRIFVILFVVLVGIIIYEVVSSYIDVALAMGAFMMGMMLGAIFVRRKKISWHSETSKVIARMDKIGIVILVVYAIFWIARHWLFHHWFRGHTLTGFSLSFAAGAMLGRLLTMRSQIREILREKEII